MRSLQRACVIGLASMPGLALASAVLAATAFAAAAGPAPAPAAAHDAPWPAGGFQLKSAASSQCLSDAEAGGLNGATLLTCDAASPKQAWTYDAQDHKLVNAKSGLCLGPLNREMPCSAKVIVLTKWHAEGQHIYMTYDGNPTRLYLGVEYKGKNIWWDTQYIELPKDHPALADWTIVPVPSAK
jgi:Ricin-type beta-trefoil lectin domain